MKLIYFVCIVFTVVVLSNALHEEIHVYQLAQYNITPDEVCYFGHDEGASGWVSFSSGDIDQSNWELQAYSIQTIFVIVMMFIITRFTD